MPGIRVHGATATCRAPVCRRARTAASTVRGGPGGVGDRDRRAVPARPQHRRRPHHVPVGVGVGRRRHRQDHGVAHPGTGRAQPPGQDVGHEPVGPRGAAICTDCRLQRAGRGQRALQSARCRAATTAR